MLPAQMWKVAEVIVTVDNFTIQVYGERGEQGILNQISGRICSSTAVLSSRDVGYD